MPKPTRLPGTVTRILMMPLRLRVYPHNEGTKTSNVPKEVITIYSDSYVLFTLSDGRIVKLAYRQFQIDTQRVMGRPDDPDAGGFVHTLLYRDSKDRWYSHEIAEDCKQETCPRYMDNV